MYFQVLQVPAGDTRHSIALDIIAEAAQMRSDDDALDMDTSTAPTAPSMDDMNTSTAPSNCATILCTR